MTDEMAEVMQNIATSPDYYAVTDASLKVQMRRLGDPDDEDILRIPLAEAEVNTLDEKRGTINGKEFARVLEVLWKDERLFVEADHRGPEHGIDAWIGDRGEANEVSHIVRGVTVEKGVSE